MIESYKNQCVNPTVVTQSLKILWKKDCTSKKLWSTHVPPGTAFAMRPGTTPSTENPQSYCPPSLPPLASSLPGGSIESQSVHWRRNMGSELLRDLVWDQGDHPDGPGSGGDTKYWERQYTVGFWPQILRTPPIAIAEWLLLQCIHREWRLFLLPLLVVSLIAVSSKCGKSYALQPGAPQCCFVRFLANVQEWFIA